MNNAKVQNIKKQKPTKARRVAPFLSTDRNHFLINTLYYKEGWLKRATVNLIGHQRSSRCGDFLHLTGRVGESWEAGHGWNKGRSG